MEFDIFMNGSAADIANFLIDNAEKWIAEGKLEYIDVMLKKLKVRADFDAIVDFISNKGSFMVIANCIKRNMKDVAEKLLELGFPVNPIKIDNLSENERYEKIVELCRDRSVHFEFIEYRKSRNNKEDDTTVKTTGDLIIYLLCNGQHEKAEFFLSHNKVFPSGEHVINYKPGRYINSCAIYKSGELIRCMNQLNLFSAAIFSGKKETIEWVFDILRKENIVYVDNSVTGAIASLDNEMTEWFYAGHSELCRKVGLKDICIYSNRFLFNNLCVGTEPDNYILKENMFIIPQDISFDFSEKHKLLIQDILLSSVYWRRKREFLNAVFGVWNIPEEIIKYWYIQLKTVWLLGTLLLKDFSDKQSHAEIKNMLQILESRITGIRKTGDFEWLMEEDFDTIVRIKEYVEKIITWKNTFKNQQDIFRKKDERESMLRKIWFTLLLNMKAGNDKREYTKELLEQMYQDLEYVYGVLREEGNIDTHDVFYTNPQSSEGRVQDLDTLIGIFEKKVIPPWARPAFNRLKYCL